MTKPNSLLRGICDSATLALACVVFLSGCGKSGTQSSSGGGSEKKTTVANIGSDTMVNIAAAWAEAYGAVDKTVLIEVNGGGSGVGIKGLINGTAEIANSSRHIEDKERAELKEKRQLDAKEFIVGFDALSIYVHKDNPLNEITMEQLGEIYRSDGKITKWTELGVSSIPGGKGDEIIRVSRQNNSGTYEYFREWTLGTGDFKLGSRDMQGSKDVVDLVMKTPCAIGYSGMGYVTPEVKAVCVANDDTSPCAVPTLATVLDGTYPISRALYMYTLGEPTGNVKEYLQWITSDQGQAIVERSGFVPLPADKRSPVAAH